MKQAMEDERNIESFNKQLRKAYVAGFIDSNATVTAYAQEDDDYSHGYSIRPTIKMTRHLPFALEEVDDFCLENGIRSNFYEEHQENEVRYAFQLRNRDGVLRFIDNIYPFLRDRREEAELLAHIVARLENGDHLDKEGFVQVMEEVDELREMNPNITNTERTEEYFRQKWDM